VIGIRWTEAETDYLDQMVGDVPFPVLVRRMKIRQGDLPADQAHRPSQRRTPWRLDHYRRRWRDSWMSRHQGGGMAAAEVRP
jgi:hypothetical protein